MSSPNTRRTVIKGPTLGAGAPDAVRQRFVFEWQSNGMNPNHIIPTGLGTRRDQKLFKDDDAIESLAYGSASQEDMFIAKYRLTQRNQ